jgi:regulator of sigma E protease
MTGAIAITAFVVALVVAVMIHEYGHLLTAKWFGMRADRFFVGFGPTLWSTRRGETEYGLKAFPLGGFVSIRGMAPVDERRPPVIDEVFDQAALARDRERAAELVGASASDQVNLPEPTWERLDHTLTERGTPADVRERIVRRTRATLPPAATAADGRSVLAQVLITEVGDSQRVGDLPHRLLRGDEGRFFSDRPAWQRAIVLVTGPLSHLLIAFGLLLGAYLLISQPTGEVTAEVAEVVPDSAADEAGLAAGDLVLAVGGVESQDFVELRDAIRERPGEATTLTVQRDGEPVELTLVPDPTVDEESGQEVGQAGFLPALETDRLGPIEATRRAALGDELAPVGGVVPMIGASFEGMVRIFSPEGLGGLVTQATGQEARDAEGAVSLVGAASIAGQTAEAGSAGLLAFLTLLAFINVFFFLFNMAPVPPFDGGHLAVVAIERTVNGVRRLAGRTPDYTVDPRAIVAVTLPVIAVLGLVLVTTLWLDITDPIRLG